MGPHHRKTKTNGNRNRFPPARNCKKKRKKETKALVIFSFSQRKKDSSQHTKYQDFTCQVGDFPPFYCLPYKQVEQDQYKKIGSSSKLPFVLLPHIWVWTQRTQKKLMQATFHHWSFLFHLICCEGHDTQIKSNLPATKNVHSINK